MSIGHGGSCVLVVFKSFQLEYGGQRSMAFGIFNSLDCIDKLDASHVMNNKSIGRLQLSLTDLLKTDLAKGLEKNFPVRAPPVEQRSANPPRREIEENQTESSASTSDKEATAPTLHEQSSRETAESKAEVFSMTLDEEQLRHLHRHKTKAQLRQRRFELNWNLNTIKRVSARLNLHSL
jgi:hypothetical protein